MLRGNTGEGRSQMKLKDREIKEERVRERELEKKTSQDNLQTEITEHFTHPHPLTYTESEYKQYRCNSCTGYGKGKRYRCAQCNFDLHKVCAQSPIVWLLHKMPSEEIERFGIHHDTIETFAHPQHSMTSEYKQKLFRCDHCKNVGDGLRYYCEACNVTLHQVCAEQPTRLISHLHPQHELELKLRPHFKYCELCGTKGSDRNNLVYTCKDCEFFMHPECSQLPLYLLHPLHSPHPLVLQRSCSDYRCSACSEWKTYGSKYSCTQCGLDFDHTCILKKSVIGLDDEVRQNHIEHKITVLPVVNLISSYSHIASPRDPSTASTTVNFRLPASSIIESLLES
ncbi:uncharacterized protein LOC110716478 [Chenopodium quinoa]|uniref:uncharacterized protein LOC110716478 n=1 Tax=Chenopodium quinoa TaxID=63459 RepID=UPI000B776002|nr:uncharacterized protein LOC110716478 [Chenopodium quinoa]